MYFLVLRELHVEKSGSFYFVIRSSSMETSIQCRRAKKVSEKLQAGGFCFVFILSHYCWLTILTQEFPHAGLRTGTDPWSQRKMRSLVSPSDFYMHIADFKVA